MSFVFDRIGLEIFGEKKIPPAACLIKLNLKIKLYVPSFSLAKGGVSSLNYA